MARSLAAAWSRLQGEFPRARVLLAIQNGDTKLRDCKAAPSHLGVAITRDPGGKAARQYNVHWPARAVAIDTDGTVAYVQSATTPDLQAPDEIGELWRH